MDNIKLYFGGPRWSMENLEKSRHVSEIAATPTKYKFFEVQK